MKKNYNKLILDLCGGTGSWSKPYADAGYDVKVITLPEFDVTKTIIEGEHLIFCNERGDRKYVVIAAKVHGILAAPPCTKFSKADTRLKRSQKDFTEGMETVLACLKIIWACQMQGAPLQWWALENPQGYLSRFLGRSHFRFQHWEFGEKRRALATKRTEIWGYFDAPAKQVRKRTIPTIYAAKDQHNRGWSSLSIETRAQTCSGFAAAFFKKNQ